MPVFGIPQTPVASKMRLTVLLKAKPFCFDFDTTIMPFFTQNID